MQDVTDVAQVLQEIIQQISYANIKYQRASERHVVMGRPQNLSSYLLGGWGMFSG